MTILEGIEDAMIHVNLRMDNNEVRIPITDNRRITRSMRKAVSENIGVTDPFLGYHCILYSF